MSKLISILLSVLLLISSTGITYAQHYCGEFEMLSKVTLGEEHLSCDMVMEALACEENDSENHHCCNNQYTSVITDDNFAKANFNVDFHQAFVLSLVSVFVLQQLVEHQTSLDNYTLYYPPPLQKNIPVLYQTFLI